MAKSRDEDRVKDGRTRIGMVIDDEILKAIDMLAGLNALSRAKALNILLESALYQRGYTEIPRKYPEAYEYWTRIWQSLPATAFEHGRIDPWASIDQETGQREAYEEELGEQQDAIWQEYQEAWDRIDREQEEEERLRTEMLEKGKKNFITPAGS